MAAAPTYEPIETQTLSSNATSVTFSSIPATYTDLVLIIAGTRNTTSNTYLRVGAGSIDTGSNYSTTYIFGDGTTVASNRQTSTTAILCDADGNNPTVQANWIIQIQNYSNATTFKSTLCRRNNASSEAFAGVGLWRSTSAINTIRVYPSNGEFTVPAVFTLYGIKAA